MGDCSAGYLRLDVHLVAETCHLPRCPVSLVKAAATEYWENPKVLNRRDSNRKGESGENFALLLKCFKGFSESDCQVTETSSKAFTQIRALT